MTSKLSSSFDDLLNDNRNQMESLFGQDRRASKPAPVASSAVARTPHVAEKHAGSKDRHPLPPAVTDSGQISGTARGIPFSLNLRD